MIANARRHATIGEVPRARLELEQPRLQPVPAAYRGTLGRPAGVHRPAARPIVGIQRLLSVYDACAGIVRERPPARPRRRALCLAAARHHTGPLRRGGTSGRRAGRVAQRRPRGDAARRARRPAGARPRDVRPHRRLPPGSILSTATTGGRRRCAAPADQRARVARPRRARGERCVPRSLGVSKTHLAVAFGYLATQRGWKVRFTSAATSC
jgi:hypothetical protein